MKVKFAKFVFFLLCIILTLHKSFGYKEITGILDGANDLPPEAVNALWPLFNDLQAQYDYINNKISENHNNLEDNDLSAIYDETYNEFLSYFDDLIQPSTSESTYDTHIPFAGELIANNTFDKQKLSQEELNEIADIGIILQESVDEAQIHIKNMVARASQMESELLKLDKPKIVMYILEALKTLFNVSSRLSRAAYCTYSNIPQLNESLHNIYDGIDCYSLTSKLIVNIQKETVKTVLNIKNDVLNLASIYKKIANKKSLLGKLTTVILNISKIVNSILDAYKTGMSALDKIENQMPDAVQQSIDCSQNFLETVPQMIETTTNVTTCILFVDDDNTTDYDFMLPEEERDFP